MARVFLITMSFFKYLEKLGMALMFYLVIGVAPGLVCNNQTKKNILKHIKKFDTYILVNISLANDLLISHAQYFNLVVFSSITTYWHIRVNLVFIVCQWNTVEWLLWSNHLQFSMWQQLKYKQSNSILLYQY